MKNVFKLEQYYNPEELNRPITDFVKYYNIHRYHESLKYVTPEDVHFGMNHTIPDRRSVIKH